MRIIIVGGTGLIGWHAARELVRRDHSVTVMARRSPVENLLPENVGFVQINVVTAKDEELQAVIKGHDAIVHAAGADPRTIPHGSVWNYFYKTNVTATVRLFRIAREQGLSRAVLITSYFHRLRPNMVDVHPYVHSRALSEQKALDVCLPDLGLMILQPPYVFGNVPGRTTIGSVLARYAHSKIPLFVPNNGGTNAMSVKALAEAICGAIERGEPGQRYLVGGENLTWNDLIQRFAHSAGLYKKIRHVTTEHIGKVMQLGTLLLRFVKRESGLALVPLTNIITSEMFFDPAPSARELNYSTDDLDEAIKEIVASI